MRGREGKGGGGLRKDWSWPHTCTYILGLLTAFATILIDCAHMMGANQAQGFQVQWLYRILPIFTGHAWVVEYNWGSISLFTMRVNATLVSLE